MNDQLQAHARKILKEGLSLCSEHMQRVFRRMYSHGDPDMPINEVVDNMSTDHRLDWAMEQVRKTLDKERLAL